MTRTLRAALADGFRWWWRELAGLLPGVLRRRLGRRRAELVIDLATTPPLLLHRDGTAIEPVGRLESAPDPRTRAALARLAARHRGVSARLGPHHGLVRDLDLPLAAERDLDTAIGYQLETLIPFRRDEVVYACRVRARDTAARTLTATLAVAPQQVVGQARELAASIGLPLTRLEVVAPDNTVLDLLGDAGGRTAANRRPRRLVLHGAALATLAAAALYLPYRERADYLERLSIAVAAASHEADAAGRLRQNLAEALAARDALLGHRDARPRQGALLDRLAGLLDDDVWLLQYQYGDGEARISGYAPGAARLVAVIENAAGLDAPRFVAPVTREPEAGIDRFSLGFRVGPAP